MKPRRWKARQRAKNLRGPTGHWEIVTCEKDGHDQCMVQSVYSQRVAEHIVNLHNSDLDKR